jgi:hypothetical protein
LLRHAVRGHTVGRTRPRFVHLHAGAFLSDVAQLAPEIFHRGGFSVGKNADMWAAGVMAASLLTKYFPFDDIIGALLNPVATLVSSSTFLCVLTWFRCCEANIKCDGGSLHTASLAGQHASQHIQPQSCSAVPSCMMVCTKGDFVHTCMQEGYKEDVRLLPAQRKLNLSQCGMLLRTMPAFAPLSRRALKVVDGLFCPLN